MNSTQIKCAMVDTLPCSQAPTYPVTCDRRDHFQYAVRRGDGCGDLGPLHVNICNAIIESVMCKAHTGDAYCIAAASANTKLLELFV